MKNIVEIIERITSIGCEFQWEKIISKKYKKNIPLVAETNRTK